MKPLVANYFLTLSCNASCEYCFVWQNKNAYKEDATLEKIKKNLIDLKKMGVKSINFSGGEPLIFEDIVEILRFAKGLKLRTSLSTNCSFYPREADKIKGLVDSLYFSLDAPFSQMHNEIRGIDNFDQVINSIGIAKKLGEEPYLVTTVTVNNLSYLPDMVAFARKNNLLLWLNPVYRCDWLGNFPEGSFVYFDRYFSNKNVGLNLAASKFLKSGANNPQNPRCLANKAVITISPDNYLLLPCIYFPQMKVKIEDDLEKVYLDNFKKSSVFCGRDDQCKKCAAWDYIIPSFWYKVDEFYFLNAYSSIKWWLKTKN